MACHINHLLFLTGMNEFSPKDTPAIQTPLGLDIDDAHHKETYKWRYTAALVMIQYLSRNKWLGIDLGVNQFSHHTNSPKLTHDIKIKYIYHNLKVTRDKGLVFKPNKVLNVDCYVDADFAGLCHVENTE